MIIKLNTRIYPLEAILNACYAFIDRAYIFLDSDFSGKQIKVYFKDKKGLSRKRAELFRSEFMNELLHCALRCNISKNNRKIREYIVGRALCSAVSVSDLLSGSTKLDYQRDPLGIAIPWEEKYGKK